MTKQTNAKTKVEEIGCQSNGFFAKVYSRNITIFDPKGEPWLVIRGNGEKEKRSARFLVYGYNLGLS